MDLLLSGDELLSMPSMLALLAGGGGGDLEMLMDLLAALGGSGDGLMGLLDGIAASAEAQDTALPMETLELETVQVSGPDLSAVSFDPEAGSLTVDGTEHMILRGLNQEGQENPTLRLAGSGTVTLQQVNSPLLTAEYPQTRVFSAGENTLAQVQLKDGVTLTVDGGGLLRIGNLRGGASSVLRLIGGAVALTEEANGFAAVSVVVDGPVALLAAEGIAVHNAQGEPLTPFDIVWKTLLSEWSSITSLALDGRQGQLILREDQMDPVQLWLLKQDSDEKWPAHTIALRGRDKAGHPRTRYIYVRWDEKAGSFQEISMYPNPFTVTGGEQDVDWRYEEETRTLHILSREVTAIAGGAGTDGNQLPFSGRISLADGIGAVELILDGVECRVSSGRAFNLGRGNDVTLLLQRGTDNVFESGTGCAGISLGDGTSLRIDQVKAAKGAPDGTLTAPRRAAGAGVGGGRPRGPAAPGRLA
ncbi:MAG: hypothetical protein K2M15_00515, partial [Oscillospiraceae bacterium]|nr:hypothetical protein [Oscillospiraceae bacterium]